MRSKTYIVTMLIPCGLGISVARSSHFRAESSMEARQLAMAENPTAQINKVVAIPNKRNKVNGDNGNG